MCSLNDDGGAQCGALQSQCTAMIRNRGAVCARCGRVLWSAAAADDAAANAERAPVNC